MRRRGAAQAFPGRAGAGPARAQEEACRACLALAFAEEDLAEVVAGADAPNSSSLRLIERLGFEPLRETPGAFGVIRWFVPRRSDWSGPTGGPTPGDRPSRP